MKFLEKIFGSDSESSSKPLEQKESEAIIDLLLLGIYIDNHLSLSETSEFDESTQTLGWASGTSLSVYLNQATDRARTARLEEALITDFIAFAAERLGSGESKTQALELLNRLLTSDGRTESEEAYFQKVEAALRN